MSWKFLSFVRSFSFRFIHMAAINRSEKGFGLPIFLSLRYIWTVRSRSFLVG